MFSGHFRGAWECSCNARAGLVVLVEILRKEIRNQVVVSAGYDAVFELICHERFETVSQWIDPIHPHEPWMHGGFRDLEVIFS